MKKIRNLVVVRKVILFLAVGMCLGLAGCGKKDLSDFSSGNKDYAKGDSKYLVIDTNPEDEEDEDGEEYLSTEAVRLIKEVNEYLEFSGALSEKMVLTILDGTQSESNDYATVTWKYSIGRGLEVIYELK
jgi:hypothetical protein